MQTHLDEWSLSSYRYSISDMNMRELKHERSVIEERLSNPKTPFDYEWFLELPLLLQRIDTGMEHIRKTNDLRAKTKWKVGDIIELDPHLTDKRILRNEECRCDYVVVQTGRKYKLERIGESKEMPLWITKGVRFSSDQWIMMHKVYISSQGTLQFGLRKK